MSNEKNGGPAFPRTQYANTSELHFTGLVGGISKLDYFAAAALRGWMSSNDMRVHKDNIPSLVTDCYDLAEAMLAESERRSK